MSSDLPVYIIKAEFFEIQSPPKRPTLVQGRPFYSLTYRHKGKITVSCDESEFVSFADTVTFIPKGLSYTTEVLEDTHIFGVHFDLSDEAAKALPAVIPIGDPTIRTLFFSLSQKGEGASSDFSRMAILYEILAALSKLPSTDAAGVAPEKVRFAKALIEKEFSDPFFSIDALALRIGVSTTYLRRAFHSAYDISPMGYLKATRIENAKRLLLTARMSVARVAEACGYTSTSYFIQDFHKSVGRSPGDYRTYMGDTP